MPRRLLAAALSLVVAAGLVVQANASGRKAENLTYELTIGSGTYQFRVNGTGQFLVFVSYFDALDQSGSNVNTDLAYLKANGVDGVRILVNWWDASLDGNNYPDPPYQEDTDTLCDANGDLRSGTLSTLLGFLIDAKQEELIVDLTFSVESVSGLNLSEFTDCIEDLTTELANGGSDYKHVFFDLQNEYNKNRAAGETNDFSDSQIAGIVSAVKTIDSSRIVTASMSQEVPAADADGKATTANLDVVAWHEEREVDYWDSTAGWVASLDDAGLPVYLQEPARRDPDDNNLSWTIADNWAENVYNAMTAGADAWTLHTGASFELGGWTLYSVLHQEERDFIQCLGEGDVLGSGTCTPGSTPLPDLRSDGLLERFVNWLAPKRTSRFPVSSPSVGAGKRGARR